ncbi:MAG: tyrosine-type recombinase/integrase [Pseudomonadota bacterium]
MDDQSRTLRNANHPKRGDSIKVDPIKKPAEIKRIKKLLEDTPRDYCLFTLGINTAYRAKEILSITVGQVDYLKAGDRLEIKQSKTRKYRSVTLNETVVDAIEMWLKSHPDKRSEAPLFWSRKSRRALTVSAVNALVKKWCREAGVQGKNFGSHTLRKTWGYHQRKFNNQALPLLMVAYGHASEAQTLEYLCIDAEEVRDLYSMEL